MTPSPRRSERSETYATQATTTLRRWIIDVAADLVDETGDDRWAFLSFYDLQRTWAGSLANVDVDEQVALLWGGWADLETFLDHHRGEASPKAQRREREKVGWPCSAVCRRSGPASRRAS
ncbi:MAG: integrase [Haloplanus sp.]